MSCKLSLPDNVMLHGPADNVMLPGPTDIVMLPSPFPDSVVLPGCVPDIVMR
jgi:hypothetical protein